MRFPKQGKSPLNKENKNKTTTVSSLNSPKFMSSINTNGIGNQKKLKVYKMKNKTKRQQDEKIKIHIIFWKAKLSNKKFKLYVVIQIFEQNNIFIFESL